MEDPQKKSLRLLLLHRLFNERAQGYRVAELREILGVSERTVERDLLDLQAPPYSLPLIPDGWRWRLDRTHAIPLPPVTLTREQAAALFLGARLLMQHSGSLVGLAAVAVQRLAEVLPAEVGAYLMAGREMPQQGRPASAQEKIFADLVSGWLERRKVVCRHATPRGTVRDYRLAPYSLEPSAVGYAVYVRGQCDTDPPGRLRTLKLERIQTTTRTDEPFTRGPAALPETLDGAWHIWGSDEAPVEVRLRFSGQVAPRVRETVWHPSQQLSDLPGGGCEWVAQVAEPQEMLPWIRGWGAECEVLSPQTLRNALVREARRLAQLYGVAPTREHKPTPDRRGLEPVTPDDETERINRTFRDFFGE